MWGIIFSYWVNLKLALRFHALLIVTILSLLRANDFSLYHTSKGNTKLTIFWSKLHVELCIYVHLCPFMYMIITHKHSYCMPKYLFVMYNFFITSLFCIKYICRKMCMLNWSHNWNCIQNAKTYVKWNEVVSTILMYKVQCSIVLKP